MSDGNTVTCCGIEQCSNIQEEKTYNDPAPEACCYTTSAYDFDYYTKEECKEDPKVCNVNRTLIYSQSTSSGGTSYRCSGSCPAQKKCRDGVITGYQQFAWESASGWVSSNCPSDATYRKTDCQTVCGGTTGCRTICKNICEVVTCSSDKNQCKKCETICSGTQGCHEECRIAECPSSGSVTVKVH